jgi:hypothetical protein
LMRLTPSKADFCDKILSCMHYFRKGKDPDPDPDPYL